MTNEHTSLETYTSHTLFEMVAKGLCVRGELETEQTATYWPQVPLSLAALLSHSAAQPWVLRARPSLGVGSHYSILSPTNWICQWHRVIYLFDIHLLLVGVTSAPNSTRPQSRLYPDIFDRMHLLFTQVHLLFDSSAEGQYVTSGHAASIKIRSRKVKMSVVWCWMLQVMTVCSPFLKSDQLWSLYFLPRRP